jgi:cell division protein FtsB
MAERKGRKATQAVAAHAQKRRVPAALDSLYRSRRRLATVAVALLAVWLGFRVVSGPNGWMVYHQKRIEYRQLQREVQQLQKENDELQERIHALKSDPKAIEREAREQLRYAKPGEIIYVLPAQKAAPPAPPAGGVAQASKP